MESSKKFWIFFDAFCFFGFITTILYNLIPIAFFFQFKSGVLKKERLSYVGILCLYGNCFIYFWISLYHRKDGDDIDPLDFCNLSGAYLGYVYLIIYIYYIYLKDNKVKLGIILILALSMISVGVFLSIKSTINEDNNGWKKAFNWIGVFFNIFENLPLGFDIIYLIKNKISEKFTLFSAFFGLLNEIVWLSWALYGRIKNKDDLYHSIIANIFGIFIQITVFFLFFKFRVNEENDENIIDNQQISAKLVDNHIKENEDNLISNNEANTTEETKEPEYLQDLM